MKLKKTRIISVICIFILCFIFHFVYEIMPNTLTSIFFPVNESIWEHIKLVYTSIIFYGFIDYIILKKFNIKFNNFFTSLFLSGITTILLFFIIYLPIYNIIGTKFIINILVMLFIIILSQIISYYILKMTKYKNINFISLLLIMTSFVIFAYLTYYPPKNNLFYDVKDKIYGINTYDI